MILGCIADDFTGAGDIASILTGRGMRTSLLTNIRDIAQARGDAVVVALKTRSVPPAEAVRQSLDALSELRAAGCRQIYFKYCSTFDSTPQGNIGPVAEALARELGADKVLVCPSFPANGRTMYQGHLFVSDRLLAESAMRDHPITPMIDSDLRRWLARQCEGEVSHIAHDIVRQGEGAVRDAIARGPSGLILIDATTDDDLLEIGRAAADMVLITGGSALAMALPENFRKLGLIDSSLPASVACEGPAIVLAGSCSAATNRQVAIYRACNPSFAIDAHALLSGDPVLELADAFAKQHADQAPLIYSTITPEDVASNRNDETFSAASTAIETLMAELATRSVARNVKRIVVAGGETSGAVVEALQPGELLVGPEITPGIPVLTTGGVAYVLKSGNFGSDDFFEVALRVMETGG